jgi:hypothetical protein
MLAEMGEHQLTIRDYLRHSNLHVTNKYLQATSKTKRLTHDKLVDALPRTKRSQRPAVTLDHNLPTLGNLQIAIFIGGSRMDKNLSYYSRLIVAALRQNALPCLSP